MATTVNESTSAMSILGDSKSARKSRSGVQLALARFRKQKLAMIGLVIVGSLTVIGFGAPILAPYSYDTSNLMAASQTPSREFPMGTDTIGRDYLTRVLFGIRTSLIVGFMAVVVGSLIGAPLGILAGLLGGWVDFAIMRLVDVLTAFPGLLFAIFVMTVVGSGLINIIFVIAMTNWLVLCRLVRAQVMSLREQEFVTSARAIGSSEARIAIQHILPNAVAPVIVAFTIAIPSAIFAEAGLSFLGLGINEPLPSLGKMVGDSTAYLRVLWHLGVFPTIAIALIMLGFSFLADGLRDALDPRQR